MANANIIRFITFVMTRVYLTLPKLCLVADDFTLQGETAATQ
jgi:hypothetical protein